MQESRGGESSEKESAKDAPEVYSEATSKETLSDVAENDSDSDASVAELDPGPSPDGAFDESKETGPI